MEVISVKVSLNSENMIKLFTHLSTENISGNLSDGTVSIFVLPINARQFDYDRVGQHLLESVADYALSNKLKEQYKGHPMTMSKVARERFKEYSKNDGELGELLLFCFLEGHLHAPKILTKLEHKTSSEMYVNGSDGIHLLKIDDANYQLIFGESKMYKTGSEGLKVAFQSVYDFKNEVNNKGNKKSGIRFEKGLISTHLENEIINDTNEEIVKMLIYPKHQSSNNIRIADSFAIFIGFEMDLEEERKELNDEEFDSAVIEKINNLLKDIKSEIYKLIEKHDLIGHAFYLYFLPFTNIAENRKKILGMVLE